VLLVLKFFHIAFLRSDHFHLFLFILHSLNPFVFAICFANGDAKVLPPSEVCTHLLNLSCLTRILFSGFFNYIFSEFLLFTGDLEESIPSRFLLDHYCQKSINICSFSFLNPNFQQVPELKDSNSRMSVSISARISPSLIVSPTFLSSSYTL
jgi:hypothetical protein